MWIRFGAAAMLVVAATGAAYAGAAPASSQACFSLVDELAQVAENKQLDQAAIDKVGQLLKTLETQCSASQLAEAGATADRLRETLGTL